MGMHHLLAKAKKDRVGCNVTVICELLSTLKGQTTPQPTTSQTNASYLDLLPSRSISVGCIYSLLPPPTDT